MDVYKMVAVVQVYIGLMKNVEVNITPDLPRELPLLIKAYKKAETYLVLNKIKIQTV